MTAWGMGPTLGILAVVGAIGLTAALRLWPVGDPVIVTHSHDDLPDNHPHLAGGGHRHAHALVIDDEHHAWPTQG